MGLLNLARPEQSNAECSQRWPSTAGRHARVGVLCGARLLATRTRSALKCEVRLSVNMPASAS